MYDYFENVAYPLKLETITGFPDAQMSALKSSFVDFRLNIYGQDISRHVFVTITRINCSNNDLRLRVVVYFDGLSPENTIADAVLVFPNDSYASQQFVRYHFDNLDFPGIDPKYAIEGFFCFSRISDLISVFAPVGELGIALVLEPSTISVFSNHRVDQISCRNVLPLLKQDASNRYGSKSDPVLGNVKLVPGNNCTISVQPATRTILIGAQQGANDTAEEQCGIWSEKVDDKDILCNEAIYSISGVVPDSAGNIQLAASSPLTVSSYTYQEMSQNYSAFSAVLSQFSHIIRFIYIGLPQSAGNPSVFDCVR